MDFSHQTILTNQYFIYICTMKERKQTLGFFLARATYGMAASLNGLLKNKGVDLTHSQYEVLRSSRSSAEMSPASTTSDACTSGATAWRAFDDARGRSSRS